MLIRWSFHQRLWYCQLDLAILMTKERFFFIKPILLYLIFIGQLIFISFWKFQSQWIHIKAKVHSIPWTSESWKSVIITFINYACKFSESFMNELWAAIFQKDSELILSTNYVLQLCCDYEIFRWTPFRLTKSLQSFFVDNRCLLNKYVRSVPN